MADDFLNYFGTGVNLGRDLKTRQVQNKLAPSLSEGDFSGASKAAFAEGQGDLGTKYQDMARKIAKEDATAARDRSAEFRKNSKEVVGQFAKIDALRARGLVDDAGYMEAVQRVVEGIKPLVNADPELAEVMPTLLQSVISAPPGSIAVYDDEYHKQLLDESDPKSRREEARKDTRLGYEGRRVSAAEETARAKTTEANVAERGLEQTFAQYGEGEGDAATGEVGVNQSTSRPFFDPVAAASGPVSAAKSAIRAIPGVGGATEAGKQERQAGQRVRALGKDILRVYTTNSSRVSNFDLQQTQKISSGSGPFKSAAALGDDLQETRRIAIKNYDKLAEAARDGSLEKPVRKNAQEGALGLQKIIEELDDILVARKIATTDIGGKPIPELTDDEIMAAIDTMTPEQKELLIRYRRQYGGG